jgi:hypothetical protein
MKRLSATVLSLTIAAAAVSPAGAATPAPLPLVPAIDAHHTPGEAEKRSPCLPVTFPPKSPFAGKVELVPLFDAGNRPVLQNGRQMEGLRDSVAFRTPAGDIVGAPSGMATDLASIPSAFWSWFAPDGPWLEAALFHDMLYKTKGTGQWPPKAPTRRCLSRAKPYDREEADHVLDDAMAALQVPAWRRWAIFTAVRTFGGAGWGS